MDKCDILIIDDDTDDVDILTEVLTKSGVQRIHHEYTAMKAFIFLESILQPSNLPNLIITDLYLPGISGAEFLQDLKAMPRYRHIVVVVLSSIKSDKEIERYKSMGALDYVIKPATYNEYVEVAERIKSKAGL